MKAIFLTEGGLRFGFGHLTRCNALRSALLERGFQVRFVVRGDRMAMGQLGKKDLIFDWLRNKVRLNQVLEGVDVAILDSYHAPLAVCKTVFKKARLAVFLDDFIRLSYPGGVVLNGGLDAETFKYTRQNGTFHLLGIKYALLRKDFWNVEKRPIRRRIRQVLITFGGMDQFLLLRQLLDRLITDFPDTLFHVIVPANKEESYRREFRRCESILFYSRLKAAMVRDLMLKCDAAVTGGGQTLNELSRCGLPAVSVCLAENQRAHLKAWQYRGTVLMAGYLKSPGVVRSIESKLRSLTYAKRSRMRAAAVKLVDGRGPHRVASFIKYYLTGVCDEKTF